MVVNIALLVNTLKFNNSPNKSANTISSASDTPTDELFDKPDIGKLQFTFPQNWRLVEQRDTSSTRPLYWSWTTNNNGLLEISMQPAKITSGIARFLLKDDKTGYKEINRQWTRVADTSASGKYYYLPNAALAKKFSNTFNNLAGVCGTTGQTSVGNCELKLTADAALIGTYSQFNIVSISNADNYNLPISASMIISYYGPQPEEAEQVIIKLNANFTN